MQTTGGDDLVKIKEEFEKIDENGDGVLTREELFRCILLRRYRENISASGG